MSLLACLKSSTFDYATFIQACGELSVFWYVWQPPDSECLRFERYMPYTPTTKTVADLDALYQWADRTDPDWKIRRLYVKKTWQDRKPGALLAFAA